MEIYGVLFLQRDMSVRGVGDSKKMSQGGRKVN